MQPYVSSSKFVIAGRCGLHQSSGEHRAMLFLVNHMAYPHATAASEWPDTGKTSIIPDSVATWQKDGFRPPDKLN